MARVKRGVVVKRRHKKILKQAKGFFGRAKNCFRIAVKKVEKSMQYAYIHRKKFKGEMRRLWIVRINAQCRNLGVKYKDFMFGLKTHNILLNRKVLSEMCINNVEAFNSLVEKAMTKVTVEATAETAAAVAVAE